MSQLKARSTEELVSKADRAADAEGISRAELIREAVEEYTDKILDEATDAINSATDAPDDFDYLADLGSEVESLENLSEAAEEANEPYPVSQDIDVDWNDEVKGWSRHRLPVIRAWLDASDSPVVEDDQMRAYLRDDFDVAESTVYRDLRKIPEQGCAFPMPEADPRWNSDDVRSDILDSVLAGTPAGRDVHAQKNPTLAVLLDEEIDREYGQDRVYVDSTAWWVSEERWVSTMEGQLERFEAATFESSNKRMRRKYQVVLRHFIEYLRDCESDVSGVDRVASRLESEGSELITRKVTA